MTVYSQTANAELTYWMQNGKQLALLHNVRYSKKTLNITEEEAKQYLAEINGELPPENDAELAIYGKNKIEEDDD